ncbi:hypothetical protein Pfo_030224 [Paulownia fortunei]|nr:hypothetical protein Pfo_030224 [Paulownia fortunei]
MELSFSPEKPGFSSSDLASDPEEKEISEGEDEDDDRNHKHRRREARYQSLEGDSLDPGLTRPYRKRNRPFENGYSYREDRDFPSRFEKRRSNQGSFSKAPLELNQRIGGHGPTSGEVGPVRGRGREPLSWGIRDSRLGLVDVASQIVQPGPVPSALPAIGPPLNIGVLRPRCRDFEERGFCLRGTCAQWNMVLISLSQFNLPVSLPGSQLLGTSSGQGALPVNSKAFHAKTSKPGMIEDGFGLNGGVVGGSMAGASDALNQSNADETESFLDMDLSVRQNTESIEGFNDELPLRNATTTGSQSSSVWGRIGSSKRSLGVKDKIDSVGTSSSYLERDIKSEKALSTGLPDVPHQGKWANVDGNGPLVKESSLKKYSDSVSNIRKPSQKALRTLFGSSSFHFQKFGEVMDIYIPMHSERAFVQFSKREEAEAALKAPDAVMGNRFIKLWWANRDNIPVDGMSGINSVPITPRGVTLSSALSHPFVLDKGKENPHPASSKDGNAHASVAQLPVYDHPKPMVANGPKAPPPQQKKLESLELLKEELRKKQEMLDQKRNEFRRQLDKLEKQAVGSKDVTVSDLTTKSLKGETLPNHADNITTENATSAERAVPHTSASNPAVLVQEPLKPSFRPLAPLGAPFVVNRFKLDNRPTAFRIVSPLPAGLANSERQETFDASVSSDVSARVSFTTRHFAERAFLHGKSWQGHKLQFMWLTSTNSGKEGGGSGNLSAASNRPSDANIQPSGQDASAHYKKTAALGTGEPEHLIIEADADSVEQDKDSKSTSTSFSSEKQLS